MNSFFPKEVRLALLLTGTGTGSCRRWEIDRRTEDFLSYYAMDAFERLGPLALSGLVGLHPSLYRKGPAVVAS
jgi:hypothetical protein